jgi:ABC-type xylose transport system permease subunit
MQNRPWRPRTGLCLRSDRQAAEDDFHQRHAFQFIFDCRDLQLGLASSLENVAKVVVGSFSIMGAIVAITGFMQTSYSGASITTVGDLMELDAIAACVIGGVSLKGGRGTVLGVLFGALIMACLLNGMTLLAVSPEFKFIARGAVLSLAVWMDVRLGR